ncbi:MAG TPA: hypothetical protein VIT20_00725 [Propionibacteriaceae bacterium]
MITIRKRTSLALVGLSAMVALTGSSLATLDKAEAAPAAPKPSATSATVTHANTLTPAVRKLVKGSGVAAEAKAVSSYWTPKRMKAAKSLDKVSDLSLAGKAPKFKANSAPQADGPAVSVKPSTSSKTKKGLSAQTTYPNFPYYSFGARTNGKVFFSRNGGNYVCSATVVNSEGKSLVWTAGHCVVDGKIWDSNFAFVPSYNNGSRPYGTWYSRTLTTTSGWYYNRDFSQDVGAATMNRNFGYRIADYLGAQGITWNQSANYYVSAFGFPQGSPYNGQYLTQANGYTYNAGNGTIYMYSGMTGGSSGGAWYYGYNSSTQAGYVNGHNDFIYTSSPNYMYSPYYGNQVATLYNAVRNQTV